jgi:PKD repeat protein
MPCTVKAGFNMPAQVEEKKPVTFANTSQNSTFHQWNFGDATTSTEINPIHSYATPGIYTVRLISGNANCSDTLVKSITVIKGADACTIKADFLAPVQGLTGEPVAFANKSAGSTMFAWDFGDNKTSALTNPMHTYTSPGVYVVRLIATSTACRDTVKKNITILQNPDTCLSTPRFLYTQDSIQPLKVRFLATSTPTPASTFTWQFGDGASGTGLSPVHTYFHTGTYKVCLTVRNNGCEKTTCDTVSIVQNMQSPVNLYPNPVSNPLTVSVQLMVTSDIHLYIFSHSGSLLKKVTYNGQSGRNSISIDVSNLQSGLYFLHVVPDNHAPSVKMFLKY